MKDVTRFDAHTLYVCATGIDLYACPYPASCLGGSTSANASTMVQRNAFCKVGYDGPLCFICIDGFYRDTGGSCARCGADEAAARAAFDIGMAFFIAVVTIALTIFVYGIPDTIDVFVACFRKLRRQHGSSARRRAKMTYAQLQRTIMIKQVTNEIVTLLGDKSKMVISFFQIVGMHPVFLCDCTQRRLT